jgi:hypothetical protein
MALSNAANEWLARLRHDLVKRVVWPARDRRDLGGLLERGGPLAPGELVARLIDEEGRPTAAEALWARLAADAPAGLDLADFERALHRALRAAAAGQLEGVLALEPAFDALVSRAGSPPSSGLARSVKDGH